MRTTNDGVITAFWQGDNQEARSHSGNLRCEGNVLFSYHDEIARILEDGSMLVRSQEEARSATSSAHINKAIIKFTKSGGFGCRVEYRQLKRWGLSPETIKGARERKGFERMLELPDGNWLYAPPVHGRPIIQTYLQSKRKVLDFNTWFLLDQKPISSLHFARSMISDEVWDRVKRRGAFLLGGYVFIPIREVSVSDYKYPSKGLPVGDYTLNVRCTDTMPRAGSFVYEPELCKGGGRVTAEQKWSSRQFVLADALVQPVPTNEPLVPSLPRCFLNLMDWI